MAYTIWENLEQVERYARKRYRHWDQRWISHREENLIANLFTRHNLEGPILDVPVGYGRFQKLLSRFGPIQALDFNYYAVLYQQAKLGLASGSVTGLAEALPYKDGSFETVFSLRLLQHIHEREQRVAILKEFKRVSRRWVVASLYIKTPLHRLHRRIFRQPSRITMISHEGLLEEARVSGLKLVTRLSVVPGLHAHRICLFSVE
ncbi:MAG: class I SAM-dependent methyltransferase [Fidelibacterota bacterium]|nr:MAG: class I SAM-dependent methyltransferase [Candidatus Neomarinimicrobiota bacterium]